MLHQARANVLHPAKRSKASPLPHVVNLTRMGMDNAKRALSATRAAAHRTLSSKQLFRRTYSRSQKAQASSAPDVRPANQQAMEASIWSSSCDAAAWQQPQAAKSHFSVAQVMKRSAPKLSSFCVQLGGGSISIGQMTSLPTETGVHAVHTLPHIQEFTCLPSAYWAA